MRRPHVYERSAPRRRREEAQEPRADAAGCARSVARAMPALVATAEAAGLTGLAELLDAAWAEAERVEDEASKP